MVSYSYSVLFFHFYSRWVREYFNTIFEFTKFLPYLHLRVKNFILPKFLLKNFTILITLTICNQLSFLSAVTFILSIILSPSLLIIYDVCEKLILEFMRF